MVAPCDVSQFDVGMLQLCTGVVHPLCIHQLHQLRTVLLNLADVQLATLLADHEQQALLHALQPQQGPLQIN
eukprot:1154772-Heterocapsa_arctica.AAC.1